MTEQSAIHSGEKLQTVSQQNMTAESQITSKQEILSPKVIEVGFIEKGTGKHQSNTIYSSNGCVPCLNSVSYKEPVKIVE